MKRILIVPSLNPKFKGWLVITPEGEGKTFLLPEQVFTNLLIECGRRFKTLAPLAPYPFLLGCELKTNDTIYKWLMKKLEKLQKQYEYTQSL